MPLLRSQTRTTSGSLLLEDDIMICRGAEVTSTPVDPLPSSFGKRSKFTFPLAPPVSCNIINIDVSSGGSSEDRSDVSIASNESSIPSSTINSPSLEDSSNNLNIATLHQSVSDSTNSSTFATAQLTNVTSTTSTSLLSCLPSQSLSTNAQHIPVSHLTNLIHQATVLSPIAANNAIYPGSVVGNYPLYYHNNAIHVANNLVDHESSLQLLLQENSCYEVESGMNNRLQIISELDILIKQWVRSEGLRQGMNWRLVEQVGGKVVSYGSFKLSVVDKDSDLDLLCVFPSNIQREDFFVGLFEALSKKEHVSELRQLSCAFVPVIKFRYRNIDIDLTMARLAYDKIPVEEEFIQCQQVTRGMEGPCLRSLNGYRATCELLRLVPSVDRFQIVLRVVKLWAKRNGIYGNMLGYLGGASWSILVARVCQISGEAGQRGSIANLIYWFFHTFANWNWPDPVYIKKVSSQPASAWNPQMNYTDREHAMPIITSSIPQMNSAVNVSRRTCQLIKTKLKTGLGIVQAILEGSKPWSCLAQPVSIFQEFEEFILVCGTARGDSCLWFGTIESKLRKLCETIQSCTKVSSARIWPEPHADMEGSDFVQIWSIGITIQDGRSDQIQDSLHVFTDLLMSTATRLQSTYERTFSVSWHQVSRPNLTRFISDSEYLGEIVIKPSNAAVSQSQTKHQVVSTQVKVITSVASLPQSSYNVQEGQGHSEDVDSSPMFPCPQIHQAHYTSNLVPIYTGVTGQSLPGPGHYYGIVSPAHLYPPIIPSMKPLSHKSPSSSGLDTGNTSFSQQRTQLRGDHRLSPREGRSQRYEYETGSYNYPPLTSVPPPPPFSPISQFTSPPPAVTSNLPSSNIMRQEDTSQQARHNSVRNIQKESSSDETDRLRSVSFSSDKFPPSSLALARVSHQDQLPPPISPRYTMAGVVPLVTVDTSVPPPPCPSVVRSSSPAIHLSTPPTTLYLTFDNVRKGTCRKGRGSPRVSISEIPDLSTPLPVVRGSQVPVSKPNIKFSFSQDSVFRY